MSKRARNIIVVLLCLIVAVVAFAVVKMTMPDDETAGDTITEVFNIAPVNENTDIIWISYTNEYGEFSFTYNGETWVYDGDNDFPVEQSYVTNIVQCLKSINALRDISDEADSDSVYGFEQGGISVTAKYSDNTQKSFIIGDVCNGGNYLKYDCGIYVVGSGLRTACSYDIMEMIQASSMISFLAEEVVSFNINGTLYTDADIIEALVNEQRYININSAVAYKNAEQYGFNGSENTVTISYTTLSYSVEDNSPETKANEFTFKFTVNNGNEYLMIAEDPFVYLSNGCSDLLEILNAKSAALKDGEIK